MPPKRITTEARFWEKVNKNGPTQPHMDSACWEWTGARDSSGYGNFQGYGAHRVSLRMALGELPPANPYTKSIVCHRCDNPRCVRPDHLFLGDAADNGHDCALKGRARNNPRRGSTNAVAKMTEAQVLECRELWARRACTQRALAKRFGVSPSTLCLAINGKQWSHLR